MEKIRVGIIGIGNMGTSHAQKLIEGECPEFDLVAICDKNPARIAWGKENLKKELTYFDNAEAMLDSGLLDACMVVTPHYDHPGLAMACMRRGIHVLVEKPAGVYTKQVREMNEESEKHNVKFAMMFNQRTIPMYQKLRQMVQSGEFGNMRRVNWIMTNWYRNQKYYDSGDWRATWSGEGGGVLMNQCPHQLDLLQWICGMPKAVKTEMHCGKWHDIEVEDDVTTYMEYENGATGVFIASTGDVEGTNRLEIQMDKGKFVVDTNDEGSTLTITTYEMTEQEWSATATEVFGRLPRKKEVIESKDGSSHMAVVRAWGGAILRGEPMIANGTEGINGLTLCNAMYLSSWLSRKIELPMDEDAFYEELMKRVATSRRKTAVEAVVADTKGTY